VAPRSNLPVVIVGAGPAGMVLALLLVSRGVPVRVLERHADFAREFHGEMLAASALPVLDELGILPELVARGLARPGVEVRTFRGTTRRAPPPSGVPVGALISQPGLLTLLHERCAAYPHYALDFQTAAHGVERAGGRVIALRTRRDGRDGRVPGEAFVLCSGRGGGALRRAVGVAPELAERVGDVLWLRFDFADAPETLPDALEVHRMGAGVVVVLVAPVGRSRLQVAYGAPGALGALRRDPAALRERLLPALTEPLRGQVAAKLAQGFESRVLHVVIDRLRAWHVPGLLCLGDAAHTMSPVGGMGLNLAIHDSVAAARHILDAVQAGAALDTGVFARVEAERRPEVEAAQAAQRRAASRAPG
jgi:2-polyprenyl-6-methoxyphenol hydroxylase-like FAD-dependent oxidoreductase